MIRNQQRTTWLLLLAAMVAWLDIASAQFIPAPIMRGFGRAIRAAVPTTTTTEAKDDDNEVDERFTGGPTLKTDLEAKQLLKRAEQFAAEGRHDLAAVLWQKVLDDSGDGKINTSARSP